MPKITSIRTLCLSRPHEPERQWITAGFRVVKADCAIVVVETDSGIDGLGEACAYGVPPAIAHEVEDLGKSLVGRDPVDPSIAPSQMDEGWGRGCAVAGLDCALWDLRGKLAGKRVSELLAVEASPADSVHLYASSGCRYDWGVRPEQLIDETVGYADQGFTACKVRLGTDWSRNGVTVGRFLQLMRELSRAAGGRMRLMVDGNQRLTEDQAREIALELGRLGFAWFEEPIPQDDIDGYIRLNSIGAIPISGGEQYTTLERFEPYIRRHAYSIVQPDAGICGITEADRIARRAAEFGIGFRPHNWHNGLMALANAHLVAVQPQPGNLELCMIQGPLQWDILKELPEILGGSIKLPAGFGLGADLAGELESRFPYQEGSYAVALQ